HDAPYESAPGPCILRHVFSDASPRVRPRLEARGLSVARNLGGKPQSNEYSVEWGHVDAGNGIWSFTNARVSPGNGRSKATVRRTNLSVVACEEQHHSGILRRGLAHRLHSGNIGMAIVNASLLEAKSIHKSFAGVHALKGVDFDLRPGEVHALI